MIRIESVPAQQEELRMKAAYPVLSAAGKKDILVSIPDFNINTQGKALADAMEMARDAIGIIGMDREERPRRHLLP